MHRNDMKKAAALSLATFYLLLTTGLFVCNFDYGGYFLFELTQKATIAETSVQVDRMIESHKNDRTDVVCTYLSSREVIKPGDPDQKEFYPLIIGSAYTAMVARSSIAVHEPRPMINRPFLGAVPIYLKKRVLLI
ncbi:hypothetical protein DJ568_03060 [Mucilaginibacter hurinus]|uniref:Uncharacterized protein n=2 Tax=Mucilaginibacter hurinus TaxID=2201324 RepID=A0A367GU69_9SPHI|nr:hypothetical protein DJ568_03060 [Mucilaginibacter hurinus]